MQRTWNHSRYLLTVKRLIRKAGKKPADTLVRRLEVIDKVVRTNFTGRKIVTKETQEGCLLFAILSFKNSLRVFKTYSAC